MRRFQNGMNENFYVECRSCGSEFYSTNEDDQVLELCTMCQDFGPDHLIERGNEYPEICNCEDYPCCGH